VIHVKTLRRLHHANLILFLFLLRERFIAKFAKIDFFYNRVEIHASWNFFLNYFAFFTSYSITAKWFMDRHYTCIYFIGIKYLSFLDLNRLYTRLRNSKMFEFWCQIFTEGG
jgi:hypothetical protein